MPKIKKQMLDVWVVPLVDVRFSPLHRAQRVADKYQVSNETWKIYPVDWSEQERMPLYLRQYTVAPDALHISKDSSGVVVRTNQRAGRVCRYEHDPATALVWTSCTVSATALSAIPTNPPVPSAAPRAAHSHRRRRSRTGGPGTAAGAATIATAAAM